MGFLFCVFYVSLQIETYLIESSRMKKIKIGRAALSNAEWYHSVLEQQVSIKRE